MKLNEKLYLFIVFYKNINGNDIIADINVTHYVKVQNNNSHAVTLFKLN